MSKRATAKASAPLLPNPAKIEIGLFGRQREMISHAIASAARSTRSNDVTFSFSIVALSMALIVSLLKIFLVKMVCFYVLGFVVACCLVYKNTNYIRLYCSKSGLIH